LFGFKQLYIEFFYLFILFLLLAGPL